MTEIVHIPKMTKNVRNGLQCVLKCVWYVIMSLIL
jgi:hypothetical protein